jgi:hypothetical protein
LKTSWLVHELVNGAIGRDAVDDLAFLRRVAAAAVAVSTGPCRTMPP